MQCLANIVWLFSDKPALILTTHIRKIVSIVQKLLQRIIFAPFVVLFYKQTRWRRGHVTMKNDDDDDKLLPSSARKPNTDEINRAEGPDPSSLARVIVMNAP